MILPTIFQQIEREQLLVGFCEFLEHEVPEELGKDRTVETEQDDGKCFFQLEISFFSI